jgi:hypothetical protein
VLADAHEWLLQAPNTKEMVEWVNELRYASQCEFDLGIFT